MKASDIKKLVSLLLPCTGESSILVSLANVCFTNKGVYAYNDIVATQYKWDHGLGVFGVHGKTLSSLLSGWGDKELELAFSGGQLSIKTGKAHTKLPTLSESHFIFDQPKLTNSFTGTIIEKVRLSEVLDTVAVSAAKPVYKAVVFAVKAGTDRLMAYSTSGVTMIHAHVGQMKTKALKDRVWIIPKLAVQQMLAISELDPKNPLTVKFATEGVVVEVEDAVVFSKVITDASPNFENAIKGDVLLTVDSWKKNDKLRDAIGSAAAVFNVYQGAWSFQLADGSMNVKAASADGSEYLDTIKLPFKGEGHTFYADPNLLEHAFSLQSLPDNSKAVFQSRAVLFGDPTEFLYAASYAISKSQGEQ